MKLHKILIDAVNRNLLEIFVDKRQADKVIEKCLKSNKKWGSRDREMIAKTTYECVRWMRLYDYCLRENMVFEPEKRKDFYAHIAIHFIINQVELPPWKEFEGLNPGLVLARYKKASTIPVVKYSMNDWFYAEALKQLGDKWPENAEILNKPAEIVLRVNTLKTSKEKLIKLFNEKEIPAEPIKGYANAVLVKKRVSLFTISEFKNGFFELQDANSQRVAEFLQPEPGEFVIDACAGAGGKTLHIAACMQNKGRIVAMDTEKWKLDELKKRAARAGAFNITTALATELNINKYEQVAGKLLLDVPCTGSGVIRRNPDAKWKINENLYRQVLTLQEQILQSYPKMLRVNGVLVYATCSILPEENEKQIEKFLKKHNNFDWVDEQKLMPANTGFDGFYMAKLIKRY